MATIQDSKAFVYQKDPLLDLSQRPTPIDSSSQFRQSNIINATSGGKASGTNVALNDSTPEKAVFSFSNGSNYKIRWETMGVAFKCFHSVSAADHATACASCPPWNILPYQIESVSLRFNNSSTDVYTSSNNTFVYDYMARLFKNYDADVLNHMDSQLMTPIWSDTLSTDNIYNAYDSTDNTPKVFTSLQTERRNRHNVGAVTNKGTYVIPFIDFFPRMTGVFNNLRSVQLEIQFSGSHSGHYEHIYTGEGAGAAKTTGNFNILEVYLITDYYSLSPTSMIQTVSEKSEGKSDMISYLCPLSSMMTYTKNSDLLLASQKNLQEVWIMQMAYGKTNKTGEAKVLTAQSPGNLMLVDIGADALTDTFPTHQSEYGANYKHMTGISMTYGEINYPQYVISTDQSNRFDGAALYYEYLKSLNCVGSHSVIPIPYSIWSRILPFAVLRPWSNNGSKLTKEGKDLVIKMTSNSTAMTSTVFCVICFQLRVVQISPDGSVSINY